MSIHHDITQSLPWDDILRRKSDVSCRRDSMGSRRNSLLLSDSLFDFPLTPGNRDHAMFNCTDPDPFAPLSYSSEPLPLVPSIARTQTAAPYDRLLGDRSESSIVSVPTIVSMGSYSTSQQQNQIHVDHSSSSSSSTISYYDKSNQQYSSVNHATMDHFQRNLAVAPIETTSSMFTKTKPAHTGTCTIQSNVSSKQSKQEHQQVKAQTKNFKVSDENLDSKNDNDDDDDDDDDDESGSNRFKPFHEEKWTLRYKELLEFHQLHGHAAVPHTYPANPQLARWVKRQRRQYKLRKDKRQSTMTTDRLDLLTSVGFVWDSHDVNWREKLDALVVYRREYGNCNVPSNFRDKKLATWVKCQRRQYKLYWDGKPSAMGPERILELEKVGFEWEIRSTVPRAAPTNNNANTNTSNDSHTNSVDITNHQRTNHHNMDIMNQPVGDYKDYYTVTTMNL
jgi:hypothetical protein